MATDKGQAGAAALTMQASKGPEGSATARPPQSTFNPCQSPHSGGLAQSEQASPSVWGAVK